MMRTTVSLFVALTLAGCAAEATSSTTSAPSGSIGRTESLGQALPADKYELVADGVREGPAIAVTDVLANPDSFTDKSPIRLEGTITAVCKKKGCWFTVGDEDQSIHVSFARGCEKYVPLDAEGRSIVFEGELKPAPSGAEAEHIREDAGGEAPEMVLSFVATGAALPK